MVSSTHEGRGFLWPPTPGPGEALKADYDLPWGASVVLTVELRPWRIPTEFNIPLAPIKVERLGT